MKKKAISKKLTSIALMTIAVLVLLFIFFGPEQTFSKIQAITSGISKVIRIGQPEVKQFNATAPRELEAAFDELDRIFNKWAKQPGSYCLIKYSELPKFENDCKIVIKREYDYDKMVIELRCPDEFGAYRVVKRTSNETKIDLYPCIIGGKDEIKNAEYIAADNFYNNWIDKKSERYPEFTGPGEIIITGRYDLEVGRKSYDLEDEGLSDDSGEISYLYKATSANICFFVTFDGDPFGGCNSGEAGLDDDCIEDLNPKYNVPFCEES